MKDNVFGAAWRFGVFATVCAVAMFAMIAVFGQLRFAEEHMYRAEFTTVTGLERGNFVRIAGVDVGKVKDIAIKDSATAVVTFSTDATVELTQGTRAAVRYENLIGGRYLALQDGPGSPAPLPTGATIPLDRTTPALDLDALIGGFRPLFHALDPTQVNALTGQLIQALQGEGDTVATFLEQTAALTNSLADRDELIGQVITHLNTVLGSLDNQSKQFDTTVTSLSELVAGLAASKGDISTALSATNTASSTLADLLVAARPPLNNVVAQTDRTASTVLADHDWFDALLTRLPDNYQKLARQGLYGDFFNFYLCDIYLKLNGKGGDPVFVKIAGQTTGRCAPK